jgi:predicted RNase H-related nuclease YkuK (DUF458 family)
MKLHQNINAGFLDINSPDELSSTKWRTGSGIESSIDEIINASIEHTLDGGSVYIGSDSQMHGYKCIFVTTVCLHGGSKKTSRYFFKREKPVLYKDISLRKRITDEVSNALDVFLILIESVPDLNAEIHVDIGKTEKSKTRGLVDSITGWVKGLGVTCKIKPDAWASAAVADKHTK